MILSQMWDRFGDAVECRVGPGRDDYVHGVVVDTVYRESGWAASKVAAYQIKMDEAGARKMGVPPSRAKIWATWDDDYYIRPLGCAPNVDQCTMSMAASKLH